MTSNLIAGKPTIPRLENGDRLTLNEFERRYCAMPQVKKAELIEGTVYSKRQRAEGRGQKGKA